MATLFSHTDTPTITPVEIRVRDVTLCGDLYIPPRPKGVILFAHGSGSSRHSSRNRYVAEVLQEAGLATLLFDLLTKQEEAEERFTGHLRFDIPLLADRLAGVTSWIDSMPELHELPVGYFGASTGGGAAIVAAAQMRDRVKAVVSRGGRPDLAGEALAHVEAAVLLIVGGNDEAVLRLNRAAQAQMTSAVATCLDVVPGATHLFEEPGTLEKVAELAREWFLNHLRN
jgi:alpha-beta hydrolase superfamily lysophospholipase